MRWHHLGILLFLLLSACTLGSGEGSVTGQLDVPKCWSGAFDLKPDFFAGIPYRTNYLIRVQQTADYANFADGIAVQRLQRVAQVAVEAHARSSPAPRFCRSCWRARCRRWLTAASEIASKAPISARLFCSK